MAQERKAPTKTAMPDQASGRRIPVEKAQEWVRDLLDGKRETKDALGVYLLDAVKDAGQERLVITQNLRQAEQQVAQMKIRLTELKGIHEKTLNDLTSKVASLDVRVHDAPKKAPQLEKVPDIEEPKSEEPDPEPAV